MVERFILAGAINSAFGFGVYTILALTSISNLSVIVLSNLLGMAFNYLTNSSLVFKSCIRRRFIPFLLVHFSLAALTFVLVNVLSPLVGGRIPAMATIFIPLGILSYKLLSSVVFKDR